MSVQTETLQRWRATYTAQAKLLEGLDYSPEDAAALAFADAAINAHLEIAHINRKICSGCGAKLSKAIADVLELHDGARVHKDCVKLYVCFWLSDVGLHLYRAGISAPDPAVSLTLIRDSYIEKAQPAQMGQPVSPSLVDRTD
jgi:hypothetical protein